MRFLRKRKRFVAYSNVAIQCTSVNNSCLINMWIRLKFIQHDFDYVVVPHYLNSISDCSIRIFYQHLYIELCKCVFY